MKKLFKKISAWLLSLALVAGMACPALNSYAAEPEEKTANITVYGSAQVKGPYFDYTAKVAVMVDSEDKIVSVSDDKTNYGAGNLTYWNWVKQGHNGKKGFEQGAFKGLTESKVDGVDTVTDATYSWNSIKEAIKDAYKQLPAKKSAIKRINDYKPAKNIAPEVIKEIKEKCLKEINAEKEASKLDKIVEEAIKNIDNGKVVEKEEEEELEDDNDLYPYTLEKAIEAVPADMTIFTEATVKKVEEVKKEAEKLQSDSKSGEIAKKKMARKLKNALSELVLKDGIYGYTGNVKFSTFRMVSMNILAKDGKMSVVAFLPGRGQYLIFMGTGAEAERAEEEQKDELMIKSLFEGVNPEGKIAYMFEYPLPHLEKTFNLSQRASSKWFERLPVFYSAKIVKVDKMDESLERPYKDAKNLEAAKKVKALIDALEEPTLENSEKLAEAKKAFDALTAEQQELVAPESKQALENKLVKLNELKEAKKKADEEKKAKEDRKAVDGFKSLVDKIGDVTTDSGPEIKAAKDAFAALTEDQRALAGDSKAKLDEKAAAFGKIMNVAAFAIEYLQDMNKGMNNSLEGTAVAVDLNKTEGLVLYAKDAIYDNFKSVSLDGNVLGKGNYILEKGSIKLTLKKEYLKTLSAGEHTLRINTTTGFGEVKFNVLAMKSEANKPEAKSGNNEDKKLDGKAGVKSVSKIKSVNTGDGIEFIIYTMILIAVSAALSTMLKRYSK